MSPAKAVIERDKKKRGTTRSRYHWCEEEILQVIVAPKIRECLHQGADSVVKLTAMMDKTWGPGITRSAVSAWLKKLNIKAHRTVVFVDPHDPGPAPQNPSDARLEKLADDELAKLGVVAAPPRRRPMTSSMPEAGGIIQTR